MLMSLRVDKIQDQQLRWGNSYANQNSEKYQELEGEVDYAVSNLKSFFLY